MRIIVYGECFSPPLDTLKRVVKAGDGIILATAPPYTRFLNSGVDFAVISPGISKVDAWVQEFLNHEIPCVLIDYLVEFVCKPGSPLKNHVLFETESWAERSLANLVRRSEEIVEDSTTTEEDDLKCCVCGSGDRGHQMLICGDENGSVGCGIGTHVECCDPPLQEIPDDDWFCPKCSLSKDAGMKPKSGKAKKAKTSTVKSR
uniref:PHD-type domain-containing protein n=1 Tax=Kalanchoe fedtschenkoi TaxID=63787 RepID=A0A7N0SZE8_KALFE